MNIDAHHHFWTYDPVEYEWIGEGMEVIRRDFGPVDLEAEIREAGIDGVVSVQARQSIGETEWLLNLAHTHDFIKGVVGWVALTEPDVERHLERLVSHPAFKAVRHVLQDEPDEAYMLRSEFNRGVGLLASHDLVYDILIFERHLPNTLTFVDRHPDQRFVLDHIAKPRIREGVLQPWKDHIAKLAEREHCVCKVSGMVTEADWAHWTETQLRPYWETVLEAFGPDRLMFGSDWPVCLVASRYERWVETVKRWTEPLSADEKARIFGGTAAEVYRLG